MFRRFVIYVNIISFTFIQSAFGITTERMSAYNDFLKESGVTKGEVPLKELHKKFGNQLPKAVRIQMDALLKENPDIMVPQMDVKKVKMNGQDELQINVNTPEGSLVVTTSNSKNTVYSVIGQVNGQKVKAELGYDAFLSEDQMIYQERKEQKISSEPVIYTPEIFAKLNIQQKKDYIKQMRGLLEATEAVQNAHHNNKKPVSKYEFFIEKTLLNESQAAKNEDDPCIVAGWTTGTWTTYGGGKCIPPAEAKPSSENDCHPGEWACNTALYGQGACVPSSQSKVATQNCNIKDNDFQRIIRAYDKDVDKKMNKEALAKIFSDIKTNARQAVEDCPTSKKASVHPDQISTCKELRERISSLNKLSCDYEKTKWMKDSVRFKEACSQVTEPEPKPLEVKAAAAIEEKKPEPAKVATAEDPKCREIKGLGAEVEHCLYQQTVKCPDPKGEGTVVKNYCEYCKPGFDPVKDGSQFVVKCEKANSSSGDDRSSSRDSSGGKRAKASGGWFSENKSWLIPLGIFAAVGGLMYMNYRSNQNYLDQMNAYNQAILNPTTVPTVITAPTTGIVAPPAASRTFEVPGVR